MGLRAVGFGISIGAIATIFGAAGSHAPDAWVGLALGSLVLIGSGIIVLHH